MADAVSNIEINQKAALDLLIHTGQNLGKPNGEGLQIPYAVIPSGSKLESLLGLLHPYGLPPRKPDHIKASVSLTDAKSFCQYVKLYTDARTRIFADPEALSFRAILDYHGSYGPLMFPDGNDSETPIAPLAPSPEFLDHNALLTLRKSDQWNLWMGKNEKETLQSDFAEFIEDNYRDISNPLPATMLEVARDLTAHFDVNFASKVTPKNGSVQLAYQEVVTSGVGQAGDMEIPESFSILIPVFFGEKPVQIEARLRFRINGGKLKFIYKLYRPMELLADAFDCASRAIGGTLGAEVLLGSL